ncbi:MAG: hypothetical protein MUD10_04195 [Candidatus Pacebacteria bacterium]|nr:hypothetical protein [Candidatus Paceibacterota bacterium]
MPKTTKKLFAAAVLAAATLSAASAQAITFTNPLTGNPGAGGKTLGGLIDSVMGFFFGLAVIVCPALILWGAWNIVTAADNEEKVKSGKKIITYAAVGFVVIAAAGVIKAVILDIANT